MKKGEKRQKTQNSKLEKKLSPKHYKLITHLKKEFEKIKKKTGFSDTTLIRLVSEPLEQEIRLPISIFSTELSPLESVVKFLRENKNMSLHKIAKTLNRDDSTIWTTYNNSKRKFPKELPFYGELIPLNQINNRELSILESLVSYLKQIHSCKEIASLLNRKEQTIWTAYRRAKQKNAKTYKKAA